MSDSLYKKYGGAQTVSKIVHDFYSRIGETPSLERYFAKVKMDELIEHQIRFMTLVLGGPDDYEGRSLTEAHQGLKIMEEAFGIVAEIIENTLRDAKVEENDISEVLKVVGSVQEQIVA
ncbi:MAG: group 1 truncated hemoglobin [Oligoflexales bacterium]